MTAAQWRQAIAALAARWEHGHDGLTPHCVLCQGEEDEMRALTEAHCAAQAAPAAAVGEQRLAA